MKYLLDVNVLVALVDPNHVHHQPAVDWFRKARQQGWITCALTENALVRVLSNPNLSIVSDFSVIAGVLRSISEDPKHDFIPCDASLLDQNIFQLAALRGPSHVTDLYLVGLCKLHALKLATFDRKLNTGGVLNAPADLIEYL